MRPPLGAQAKGSCYYTGIKRGDNGGIDPIGIDLQIYYGTAVVGQYEGILNHTVTTVTLNPAPQGVSPYKKVTLDGQPAYWHPLSDGGNVAAIDG